MPFRFFILLFLLVTVTNATFLKSDNIHVFLDRNMQTFLRGNKTEALKKIEKRCSHDDVDGQYACRTYVWLNCVYFSKTRCRQAAKRFFSKMSKMDRFNFKQSFAALADSKVSPPVSSPKTDLRLLTVLSRLHSPLRGFLDFKYTYKEHKKNPDSSRLLYDYFVAKDFLAVNRKDQAAKHFVLFLEKLHTRCRQAKKIYLFGNILRFIKQSKKIHNTLMHSKVKKQYEKFLQYENL